MRLDFDNEALVLTAAFEDLRTIGQAIVDLAERGDQCKGVTVLGPEGETVMKIELSRQLPIGLRSGHFYKEDRVTT